MGLKYRLGENTELMFKHGLEEPVAAPASRSDELLLSSGIGTGWRLRAGVASSRSEAGDEATRIHAGLGWSVGERHRFSLDAGVEARGPAAAAGAPGTDGWTIVAPAQVAYQLTSPHVRAGLAYRQALGAHGPGTWTASLESASDAGPRSFTRLETTGETSSLVVGTRHGWSVAPGWSASVSLEGRMAAAEAARTAASWEVAYEPAGGAVKASVGQSIQSTPAGAAAATRLRLHGRLAWGTVIQAEGMWLTGPAGPSAGAARLVEEWSVAADHRDAARSRLAVLAQAISRTYEARAEADGAGNRRHVLVAGIDGAYRLDAGFGISVKLAGKRESAGGQGGAGAAAHSAVFLAQAGAQVPLAGRLSAELFARALWDHTGAIVDGYAAELVYSLTDDIALSIGTSTLGVKDPDLYLVAPWREGLYYRLRIKL